MRSRSLRKQFENAWQQFGRNTNTVVANAKHDLVAIAPGSNSDLPAGWRVLDCVRQEVVDDLRQPRQIAKDPGGSDVDIDPVLLQLSAAAQQHH